VACQKRLTVLQPQRNSWLDHLVGPGVGQKRETSFKEDVKEYGIDGVESSISPRYRLITHDFLPSF